jgi:hypothetical protein
MNRPLEAALEVIYPVLASPDAGNALVAAKCMGLMRGYDARWHSAPYKIDGVEVVLTSDLVNPQTQRKSRSFTVAGKLDIRATEIATGAKVIFDHKTCSQDIEDPNATYWQQLVIEGQVSHYMLLEWLNGNRVDKAVWDVMRKPGISPKAVAKKDVADILETRRYFHFVLSDIDLAKFQEDLRETPMMYAARLAYDCTTERPAWYFQRRTVARLDSELLEYANELWDNGQDILAARQTGRNPRNSGACMAYNSPCKFLGVCSGHDTIDSERWARKEYVHNELPVIGEGRGTEILTNSRIRTFQTCRRKHLYQYEMGVERIDEEEKESLFFGNLWHAANEQYFLTLMKEQA